MCIGMPFISLGILCSLLPSVHLCYMASLIHGRVFHQHEIAQPTVEAFVWQAPPDYDRRTSTISLTPSPSLPSDNLGRRTIRLLSHTVEGAPILTRNHDAFPWRVWEGAASLEQGLEYLEYHLHPCPPAVQSAWCPHPARPINTC